MYNQIRSYNDVTFRNMNATKNDIWGKKDAERELSYKIGSFAFSNINDFGYVYFVNGATEHINNIAYKSLIQTVKNEYRYLNLFENVSLDRGDMRYFSYPFAGNGKFLDIPKDKPVILDCAYIFSSDMSHNKTIPNNVTQIIFSLSKSHNLSDERVGWVFSKNKITHYHILQYDNNYSINKNILPIFNKVLEYPLNYLYLKYKNKFSELYRKHGLLENSVNLFGIDNDEHRIPYYILK